MSPSPSPKLKVALVGYGYWGPNLLRNLVAQSECQTIGVVESSPEARSRCLQVYPHIPVFDDLNKFLIQFQPDAVVIATPPHTHEEIAVKCLQSGAHVLVEKPLALSVEACDMILSEAKRAGRKVMVDHTFAFHPAIQYLSDQIKSGTLGELLYYDSVRVNLGGFQPRTNVLWDLAPHDLSILDLFTGGKMPVSVSASGIKHFKSDMESLCHLNLTYDNDFVAHLHLNWMAPVKIRTVMLGGTRKMAVYDENLPTEKVKIYDKGVSLQHSSTPNDFRVSYRVGDMVAPAISNREALATMVASFVEFVKNRKPTVSDGESGRRVVRILEAAAQSLKEGGATIKIEVPRSGNIKQVA